MSLLVSGELSWEGYALLLVLLGVSALLVARWRRGQAGAGSTVVRVVGLCLLAGLVGYVVSGMSGS